MISTISIVADQHPLGIFHALTHVFVGYWAGTLFGNGWMWVTLPHGVAIGLLEHTPGLVPPSLYQVDPLITLINVILLGYVYYVLRQKLADPAKKKLPGYHFGLILLVLFVAKVTGWPGIPHDDPTERTTQAKTDAYNLCHLPVFVGVMWSMHSLRQEAEKSLVGTTDDDKIKRV
jgi:hypothetical protein